MAAWLPIYSSASSPPICDLLPPSTAAIEQQRRTNAAATFAPNFVFAVRAERVPTEHPGVAEGQNRPLSTSA
eukprot:scaffold6100_cov129-Isochrysis_galbana.AAC.2